MNKLIFTATIFAPGSALAGGYVIPNETARDLGLGQAAVANQQGAEAIFLNVAALAGPTGLDVSANGELLVNRTDWSDPMLGSASLVTQPNTPPAAAISYGAKLDNGMAWGAGVGINVPAGGSLKWPNGWPGQESVQSVSQQVYGIGVGAGFQPLPYLKVGAAYLRYQVVEELHQSINYLDHFGDAALAMSGGANCFILGAEYAVPSIPLTLAATYKHSADLTLEGNAHFTDVPPTFTTMIHDQGVSEQLTIPKEFWVGAAYEVYPNVKVMASYNYEGWYVYKSDTFVGNDGFTVKVPRNYSSAHVIRTAGEWVHTPFLPELTLRAGLLRSISDQPATTLSPSLTDASSWAVSIGAGYEVARGLRVDLGYQHAFFDEVTSSGPDVLSGTYKTQVDLLSLGLNWRTDFAFLKGE